MILAEKFLLNLKQQAIFIGDCLYTSFCAILYIEERCGPLYFS